MGNGLPMLGRPPRLNARGLRLSHNCASVLNPAPRRLAGKVLSLLLAVLLCALAAEASATYEAGYLALQKKDYPAAYREFRVAANVGDDRAANALGNLYLWGLGVPRDVAQAMRWFERAAEGGNSLAMNTLAQLYLGTGGLKPDIAKARQWAGRSARLGDAGGAFLVYGAFLVDPELQYIENGKPNREKYRRLAQRPVAERQLDIEAFEMLGRAAARGHASARLALLEAYCTRTGEENNRRALELLQAVPNLPKPLEHCGRMLAALQKLGATRASPKLVADAQTMATATAAIRGDPDAKPDQPPCTPEKTRLVRMEVTGALDSPEYLPVRGPAVEKIMLLRGSWDEAWTYSVCGKEVTVPITFIADGFGGARYNMLVRARRAP